ncbi:hypothetical protein F3I62_17000 [Pseudomonas sp. R-28-1W-6]|uniref:hypothetical protein n=1 Tax=Pseudomonas sp. R-28-1W-6 TaxID=2650101 RepID=UPI00136564ED|nr:hypothetical protein [Pseudomonas sp. R-28-1W-6]MWV13800.1 hypothetical protein [Pseudomonas sp. R-28-1W-6]
MIDLSEFFPVGTDLKTAERKALYVDILKVTEHCFANMPSSFAQAFKRLFFQGELEGYGSFDGIEVFYICLSLPEAGVEQYVKVLERFEGYGNCRAVYMLRAWLDVCVPRYPLQREHWVFMLLAIDQYDQVHPEKDRALGSDCLIAFLNSTFAALAYKGGVQYCLGVCLFDRADAEFSNGLRLASRGDLECLKENLLALFGAVPKKTEAYLDSWFIGFCQRYFSRRDLSPAFLQFCDELYQMIPAGQRISWRDESLFVPGLQ